MNRIYPMALALLLLGTNLLACGGAPTQSSKVSSSQVPATATVPPGAGSSGASAPGPLTQASDSGAGSSGAGDSEARATGTPVPVEATGSPWGEMVTLTPAAKVPPTPTPPAYFELEVGGTATGPQGVTITFRDQRIRLDLVSTTGKLPTPGPTPSATATQTRVPLPTATPGGPTATPRPKATPTWTRLPTPTAMPQPPSSPAGAASGPTVFEGSADLLEPEFDFPTKGDCQPVGFYINYHLDITATNPSGLVQIQKGESDSSFDFTVDGTMREGWSDLICQDNSGHSGPWGVAVPMTNQFDLPGEDGAQYQWNKSGGVMSGGMDLTVRDPGHFLRKSKVKAKSGTPTATPTLGPRRTPTPTASPPAGSQQGSGAGVQGGGSVTVSSGLPDSLENFPVPPGFQVDNSNAGSVAVGSGGKMDIGAWSGSGTIQSVGDFYKQAMAAQGWQQQLAQDMGNAAQQMYTKGGNRAILTITKEGGNVKVQVMLSSQ